MEKKILKYKEFEVKYRADPETLYTFKNIMESASPGSFIYIESDDVYYTKGDDFLRYRSANEARIKRAELTFKTKTTPGNNIIRTEVNLRVDNNTKETVEQFVNGLGYSFNFTVCKYAHIYNFKDAIICFYSVKTNDSSIDHFIEVEVNEELEITEEDGWEIIKKWEKLLEPLKIKSQNRLKLSLFEMYRKDK